MYEKKQEKAYSIISLLLPAIVIFGHYKFVDIRVLGVPLNFVRVLIPSLFLILTIKRVKNKNKQDEYGHNEITILCILAIWIAYGLFTLFKMPYADPHFGLLEISSLVLGIMIISILMILCKHDNWDYIVLGIKVCIVITIIIAVYEIVTARHLSISRYSDPSFISEVKKFYGNNMHMLKRHVATTVFYNENDYSAFLAIVTPFLIATEKENSKAKWYFNLIVFCFAFAVLYFNNAFICFVAFALGLIVVLTFGYNTMYKRAEIIGALIITRVLVHFLEKAAGLDLSMGNTLYAQLGNNGVGSMARRLYTYKIVFRETFITSKGLGFGAGSFTNYFGRVGQKGTILLDPHCFWLEILSKYGIVIFILFTGVLMRIMILLIRRCVILNDARCIPVIASGLSMIVASVAPSSFINFGYYWIPIAMAVFLIDIPSNTGDEIKSLDSSGLNSLYNE